MFESLCLSKLLSLFICLFTYLIFCLFSVCFFPLNNISITITCFLLFPVYLFFSFTSHLSLSIFFLPAQSPYYNLCSFLPLSIKMVTYLFKIPFCGYIHCTQTISIFISTCPASSMCVCLFLTCVQLFIYMLFVCSYLLCLYSLLSNFNLTISSLFYLASVFVLTCAHVFIYVKFLLWLCFLCLNSLRSDYFILTSSKRSSRPRCMHVFVVLTCTV